jgi:hypothetical protein
VQQLADVGAQRRGQAPVPVPELGPEAVMDQLTVMVYDAFAARPGADPAPVAATLANLRRTL